MCIVVKLKLGTQEVFTKKKKIKYTHINKSVVYIVLIKANILLNTQLNFYGIAKTGPGH